MLPVLNLLFGLSSLITEVHVDPGITVGAVYLIVKPHFSLFLRLAHFAISCKLRSIRVVDAEHYTSLIFMGASRKSPPLCFKTICATLLGSQG